MAAGSLFLVWPGALQAVLFESRFEGREEPLVRVLGMTVAIIGWLYVFGGRSGSNQFVAASVLDRIVLVPIVLIPLAVAGVFPVLMTTFAILDPVLAIVAWILLNRENRATHHE